MEMSLKEYNCKIIKCDFHPTIISLSLIQYFQCENYLEITYIRKFPTLFFSPEPYNHKLFHLNTISLNGLFRHRVDSFYFFLQFKLL